MSEWYILDGRSVVPVADYHDYFRWHDAHRRADDPQITKQVASAQVDDVTVSTVFLGMNHQWGDGPPLVFETMTFDHRSPPQCDEWCWRYSSLDSAEAGHKAIVDAIRRGALPDEDIGDE